MIEISFLGGAGEVGKSSFLVDTGVEKFLLDYGIEVQHGTVPKPPQTNLDGVFISHAHLDHSGQVPELFKRGYRGKIYLTRETLQLASILVRDSLKIQKRRGDPLHFSMNDIKTFERSCAFLEPGEMQEFTSSSVRYFNAGHVPGSVMTLVESKGKRLLYMGDVKFIDTELMNGGHRDFKDIDAIITDSTYSYANHPDRKNLEERLRQIVQETVYNDGIALVPSFAVGRTQEMLLVLRKLGIPIFMDGMGIKATEAILRERKSVRDPKALSEAFGRAKKVRNQKMRERVTDNPCAIITTAGMLNGGPVAHYISRLFNRKDCSLTLTGFQVPGTSGHRLLDTGRYVNEDYDLKMGMKTEFLDFSAHTDHDHLLEFFRKVSPEKLILVHGEHTEEFAKELKGEGFDAVAPKNGEKLTI